MSATRVIANSFALALVAGLAIGLAAQREARIKAETEHAALEHQLEILHGLAAENAQLSNLVARASGPQPLPDDQSGELLRLRAEVSELRRQCADLKNVLNEDRQPHTTPATNSVSSADTSQQVATPDYWPRNSWAFAGYATPDAALQSSIWSANKGDLKAVLSSSTGDMLKELQTDLATQSETEVSARVMDEIAGVQSIRVLDRTNQPDGTVLITATFTGKYDAHTGKLILQKVGNDWKVAGSQ